MDEDDDFYKHEETKSVFEKISGQNLPQTQPITSQLWAKVSCQYSANCNPEYFTMIHKGNIPIPPNMSKFPPMLIIVNGPNKDSQNSIFPEHFGMPS